MDQTRCDEVIVQVVARTYNKAGELVQEQISQPIKVFRNAQTRDFWGEVDKAVLALQQVPTAAPPTTKAKK